jgi:hypothetical protein
MDLSNLTSWWTQRTPAQRQWLERAGWALLCVLALVFVFKFVHCGEPPVDEKTVEKERASEELVWAKLVKVQSEYERKLSETRAELESWKTKATTKTVEVKEPVLLRCPDRPGEKPIVATKTTTMTNTTKESDGTKEDKGRTDVVVTSTTDSQKGETKTEVRYVDREVVREVKVGHVPDWQVGILVGGQVPPPALPIAGPLVLGLEAKRRIFTLGGLSVYGGVWAHTGFSAGGSLTAAF